MKKCSYMDCERLVVHNRRNIKGEYELALEWVLCVEGEK